VSPPEIKMLAAMGGTGPPPGPDPVGTATIAIVFLGVYSFPVWLLWSMGAIALWKPAWSVPGTGRRSGRTLVVSGLAVLAWAALAIVAQKKMPAIEEPRGPKPGMSAEDVGPRPYPAGASDEEGAAGESGRPDSNW
jgi:hypothetical protein